MEPKESQKFFFAYSTPYRRNVTSSVPLSISQALTKALAAKKSLEVIYPCTTFYIVLHATRKHAINKRHYLVVTSKAPTE